LIRPNPFYKLLLGLNGKIVTLDAIIAGTRAAVVDVHGTMLVADTMKTFPSSFATAQASLPVGANVAVRDVSLWTPQFYELTSGSAFEGYVSTASVKLGN
jgi:hypothetical protein